jgi:hypothetical protein
MSPQIPEIILAKKALVDAEMELGKRHFPGVRPERGAAHLAQTVLFATNYEPVKMKVAPIECDLEQVVQRGDAAVTTYEQTPPNGRVNSGGAGCGAGKFRRDRLTHLLQSAAFFFRMIKSWSGLAGD